MRCKKCRREIPEDAVLCCYCGQSVASHTQKHKSRGNGQGSVYQLPNKRYKAVKTIGYYVDQNGKHHRKTVSKCFKLRKDAVAALPLLGLDKTPEGKAAKKAKTTFKELYDLWLPTHNAGKDTLNCYKSAIKYFEAIYTERAADVDIDDLQECINECPRGKATRKNMRVTVGLMYKYGIPRGYLPEKLNLADYLSISGAEGVGGSALPEDYLDAIRAAANTSIAEQLNEEGLLVRIIVRPMALEGNYEILAGHNRTSAARLAGWAELPAEIVEADDARAIVIATSHQPDPATEPLYRRAGQSISGAAGGKKSAGLPQRYG